jgi:hypothetical protein
MNNYLHTTAKELADLVLRLVVFVLIMKFVFFDWFRFTFSPGDNPGRDQEIIRPFDSFTGGPVPATRRQPSNLPPNIRIIAPGEPDIILPPIQTHP